jgi:uncharacterized protein YceH (UPF0502 family)
MKWQNDEELYDIVINNKAVRLVELLDNYDGILEKPELLQLAINSKSYGVLRILLGRGAKISKNLRTNQDKVVKILIDVNRR